LHAPAIATLMPSQSPGIPHADFASQRRKPLRSSFAHTTSLRLVRRAADLGEMMERTVKATLAMVAMVFAVANMVHSTSTCSAGPYGRFILSSFFLALLVLVVYTNSGMFDKGAMELNHRIVRWFALAILVAEGAVFHLILDWDRCRSASNMVVLPIILAMFFSMLSLVLLYGDRFLGKLRSLIRLGGSPTRKQ
jgi:hypothetical protein